MEPEALIAFGRGRSGPAGFNAAAVNALKDPAVPKQLENLDLQMPPKDKLTPKRLRWRKAEIAKWWR
jgi:predicted DNA-binding transcriptional regulator AlpA